MAKNPRNGTRPISKKQKKLVDGIAKGLTIKDAGLIAGYNTKQAAHAAYKSIKLKFHPALEAKGYSVDQTLTEIFEKIREKLEAKKTVFFDNGGIVMETRQVVAHDIQLKAANDLARFIGIIGNGHDTGTEGEPKTGPRYVGLTLVLPPDCDPRILMDLSSRSPADHQQPVLDAVSHENEGRPGPKPAL